MRKHQTNPRLNHILKSNQPVLFKNVKVKKCPRRERQDVSTKTTAMPCAGWGRPRRFLEGALLGRLQTVEEGL